MSQATRCPSCSTLFKVVPDQLRISDGWVRCGQCQKVFDATLSLQDVLVSEPQPDLNAELLETSPSASAADNALEAGGPDAPLAAAGSDARRTERYTPGADPSFDMPADALQEDPERCVGESFEPDAPALAKNEHRVQEQERPAGYELPAALLADTEDAWTADGPHPVAQALETGRTGHLAQGSGFPAETVENPPFSPVFTTASLPEGQKASEQDGSAANGLEGGGHTPLLRTDHAQTQAEASASSLLEGAPAAGAIGVAEALLQVPVQPSPIHMQEPSFVRSARRQARWSAPAVRLALGAAVVLLAALLLVQMAVQQRHYLASVQPRWRPALEALCIPLQCTVRPYQHIASVVVDSSSFNKLRGSTYRFALALKNPSALAVALPAVELTLTDTSDQPVLRRVITPLELSAPATLPSGGEWAASVEMDLDLGGDARISGYRVLAFYP